MFAGFSDGGGGRPPALLGQALRGHREEVLLRGRLAHQVSPSGQRGAVFLTRWAAAAEAGAGRWCRCGTTAAPVGSAASSVLAC